MSYLPSGNTHRFDLSPIEALGFAANVLDRTHSVQSNKVKILTSRDQIEHRYKSATTRTADQLRLAATARIQSLGVSRDIVNRTIALIKETVFDDAPTPQLNKTSDGGIQIEWAVNGTSVVATIDPDEITYIWAMNADKKVLFMGDLDDIILNKAYKLLAKMSKGIKHRVG